MDDSELQVIIDINKSLGNINATLETLSDATKNLTDAIGKQSTDVQLIDQKLDFLKQITDKITDVLSDVKEKVTILTRQMDYKEVKEIKEKVITEQIKKDKKEASKKEAIKIEKKTFNWSDFWETSRVFFKNAKWIFFIIISLVLGALLLLNIIKWNDVKDYVPKPHTNVEEKR